MPKKTMAITPQPILQPDILYLGACEAGNVVRGSAGGRGGEDGHCIPSMEAEGGCSDIKKHPFCHSVSSCLRLRQGCIPLSCNILARCLALQGAIYARTFLRFRLMQDLCHFEHQSCSLFLVYNLAKLSHVDMFENGRARVSDPAAARSENVALPFLFAWFVSFGC